MLSIDTSLPSALRAAIEESRLVVLCGAGISMAPPSSLPSWWGFNSALLNEIKASAAPLIPERARTDLNSLTLDDLQPVAFSDRIVRSFAGPSYFPVLEVLDSEHTNPNHAALAELAQRGALRGILTSNFDTLIERAFREAAVPLAVLSGPRDLAERPEDPRICTLLKLHGTAVASSTLVDTVSQKLRGLHSLVRTHIGRLLEGQHLLVLGFSGSDLIFGEDYLAISGLSERDFGITWLCRPMSTPGPAAQRTLRNLGERGLRIEGNLPDFFGRLGLDLGTTDPERDRDEADAKARARIRVWLQEPHIGSLTTAVFCASLLSSVGKFESAHAIREELGRIADSETDLGLTGGVVFRSLAVEALKENRPQEAISWSLRERRLWSWFQAFQSQHPGTHQEEARREVQTGLGSTFANTAAGLRMLGRLPEAREALTEARKAAESAENLELQSRISIQEASLAESAGGPPEVALELARRAFDLGKAAGIVESLNEAELIIAGSLIKLAEYDTALDALEKVHERSSLEGVAELGFIARLREYEVQLRRGSIDASYRGFRSLLLELEKVGLTSRAMKTRWHVARLFLFHEPIIAELVSDLRALLGFLETQEGLHLSEVPPADSLRELLEGLASGEGIDDPAFLAPPTSTKLEDSMRHRLMVAEFEQENSVILELLAQLCGLSYGRGRRFLDAAGAFVAAARRHPGEGRLPEALNFLGMAHDLLGELAASRRAYEAAVASGPRGHLEAQIWMHLAVVLSRMNENGAAELLEEARRRFMALGEAEQATHSRLNLALHWARRGNYPAALREGEVALTEARGQENFQAEATLELRLVEWRWRVTGGPVRVPDVVLALWLSGQEVPHEWRGTDADLESLRNRAWGPAELANLGLIEVAAGEKESARKHFVEAMRLYTEESDRVGVSQCLNNLASLAAREMQWGEAVDLAQRALTIRREEGDTGGEILTLATLSLYLLRSGRAQDALAAAQKCIILIASRPPSAPLVDALQVVVAAASELGLPEEAISAMHQLQKLIGVVSHPALEALEREVPKSVVAQQPGSGDGLRRSGLDAAIEEAERLQRTGRLDESLSLVDELLPESGLEETVTARLLGTRGNALQTAGRFEEAVAAFAASSDAFRAAGISDLASQADQHRAASLRRLGRLAEAEQLVRQGLEGLGAGPRRAMLVNTLLNILFERLEKDGTLPDESFEEARGLLVEVTAYRELSDEERGILELQSSNIAILEARHKDARRHLDEARRLLVRWNSRYLEKVEAALKEFEGIEDKDGSSHD